jgi:23S rRNA (adenine-N6)-dimethyltransferase
VPAGGPARRRRRELGQHDLIDAAVVDRLVGRAGVVEGDLVLDIGAGHGPVTDALLRRGARVEAIELDRARAAGLEARFAADHRVQVITGSALRVPLPDRPYTVVANPPFAITTRLLQRLLGDLRRAPTRMDLVLHVQAARFLASPFDPIALAWAPWWEVELGMRVPRRAFRPQPPCDARVLTVRRREAPLLPPEQVDPFARFVAVNHSRWVGPDRGAAWWARRFRSRSAPSAATAGSAPRREQAGARRRRGAAAR